MLDRPLDWVEAFLYSTQFTVVVASRFVCSSDSLDHQRLLTAFRAVVLRHPNLRCVPVYDLFEETAIRLVELQNIETLPITFERQSQYLSDVASLQPICDKEMGRAFNWESLCGKLL